MRKWLHNIKAATVEVCFPRRCPVCGQIVIPRGELICPGCAKKLSPVRQPVCLCCGKEVEGEGIQYCGDCARRPKTFRRNYAVFNYTDIASRSMAAVKYKNRREYLDFYSQAALIRYGDQIRRLRPDVLVPVPVHPSRRRSRGFNQAEILADYLGRQLGIPVCPRGLKRVRKTMPQKELGPGERLKNLRQAFGPGELPGSARRVLLVDDIYTTGSTLEACARILREMGVEEIYGLTLFVGGKKR